jgi:Tol biopolymer transport system component
LQLQPLGPGQPRDLPTPTLVAFDQISWSDGGQRLVYEAQSERGEWSVYTQQIAEGQPVRITQARAAHAVISPDGKTVALRESRGGISLYPADGGQPVTVKAATDAEVPVRFAQNGKSLLVVEPTGQEMVLTEIDLAGGRRQLLKRLSTGSPSVWTFTATPDLKYYAYTLEHYTSVLYTVENLR